MFHQRVVRDIKKCKSFRSTLDRKHEKRINSELLVCASHWHSLVICTLLFLCSSIREAIIRIMTRPVWRGSKSHGIGNRNYSDPISTVVGNTPRAQAGNPSMCIFWCACAIGALVQGRSLKSVRVICMHFC